MAQIPTLQNQVRQEAAPNVQVRPLENTAAQSVGAGLSNVGEALHQVQRQEQLKADRAAFMDADRETDTVANDLMTRAQSLQGKDAIGSAPQLLEEFDKQATQTGARLKGSRAKLAYQEAVNARRASLQRALDGHEGQQREAYYAKSREDYKDQAHINAVSQYQDPKAIEGEIEKIRATVDQTPGMDEAQKATELGVRRSGVYTGVVQRYLANDNITGAEKFYRSVKERVNGDKAAYIENAITDAKRAAEARDRVLVDRREAIAERAVAKMRQQISAGVPATPEAWLELQNTVKGTSAAAEFDDLVAGEKEVQTTLRMPIADQVRLVQDKEARLLEGGGTLAQAANVERLKRAVNQNISLVQSSPLLYAERRLNLPSDELNLSNLGDEQGKQSIAVVMQERAANIRTVQKQIGAPVQMKPLLPQEVDQLGQLLERASPKEVVDTFTALRDASGTAEVFNGAMAQLAPDRPVTAHAGNLASAQRELTLGTHWFTADDVVDSGDVAATLLRGERILNPSKTEKGQDGAPQKKLFLPEDKALQQRFVKVVGNAFAGRDDAAEKAFQVVKAYYVGKASRTGKMAQDSTDIDDALVREAVKASLGNVVDYNGNGKVLVPWGMSQSEFGDRVERAFTVAAKQYGLPDSVLGRDSFALVNTDRDGVYAVKLGNKFIPDANNHPVLIDLRVPDPRAGRGFVNRGGQ